LHFFEIGMAWWWPNWRLKKLCHVSGLENVNNLNGQGAVLLGMHFTTLDLGGTGLSLYQSYGSMYRTHESPCLIMCSCVAAVVSVMLAEKSWLFFHVKICVRWCVY